MSSSCDHNWNPGRLMFYGRAELKTSDHRCMGWVCDNVGMVTSYTRPVIAVIDVEVVRVNTQKQHVVARDVTLSLGPPDGTIVISGNTEWENIQTELLQCGDIVFVRYKADHMISCNQHCCYRLLGEQILVTFKESKSALAAVKLNGSEVVCYK